MRAACYARVSTLNQKTLSAQMRAMKSYVKGRKWNLISEVKEIGAGAEKRKKRQELIDQRLERKLTS